MWIKNRHAFLVTMKSYHPKTFVFDVLNYILLMLTCFYVVGVCLCVYCFFKWEWDGECRRQNNHPWMGQTWMIDINGSASLHLAFVSFIIRRIWFSEDEKYVHVRQTRAGPMLLTVLMVNLFNGVIINLPTF